jgi:hypothetical protein
MTTPPAKSSRLYLLWLLAAALGFTAVGVLYYKKAEIDYAALIPALVCLGMAFVSRSRNRTR